MHLFNIYLPRFKFRYYCCRGPAVIFKIIIIHYYLLILIHYIIIFLITLSNKMLSLIFSHTKKYTNTLGNQRSQEKLWEQRRQRR